MNISRLQFFSFYFLLSCVYPFASTRAEVLKASTVEKYEQYLLEPFVQAVSQGALEYNCNLGNNNTADVEISNPSRFVNDVFTKFSTLSDKRRSLYEIRTGSTWPHFDGDTFLLVRDTFLIDSGLQKSLSMYRSDGSELMSYDLLPAGDLPFLVHSSVLEKSREVFKENVHDFLLGTQTSFSDFFPLTDAISDWHVSFEGSKALLRAGIGPLKSGDHLKVSTYGWSNKDIGIKISECSSDEISKVFSSRVCFLQNRACNPDWYLPAMLLENHLIFRLIPRSSISYVGHMYVFIGAESKVPNYMLVYGRDAELLNAIQYIWRDDADSKIPYLSDVVAVDGENYEIMLARGIFHYQMSSPSDSFCKSKEEEIN